MSKELKIRILEKLCRSKTNCRSLDWLKEKVEKNENRLRAALDELSREFKIRRREEQKNEFYCLPSFSINSVKAGYRAYNHISKAKKPLTSKNLAKKLNLDSSYVYKVCKRFADRGYITKGDPEEKRLFFAPLTNEVVHSGNYTRVQGLYRELHGIVSKFNIEDPNLVKNLSSSLEDMQGRESLVRFNKSIGAFKNDVLTEVNKVKTKSEARELLGIKPFYRNVTTWKSSR